MSLRSARFSTILNVVAAVAMLIASVAVLNMTQKSSPPAPRPAQEARRASTPTVPEQPLRLDDAEVVGLPGSPLVIVEFSDFDCPFCKQFAIRSLPVLRKSLIESGKVRLAFRQFPMPRHPVAVPAAVIAKCAGMRGMFWQVHDRFFALKNAKDPADFEAAALAAGVDDGTLNACEAQGRARRLVEADIAEGRRLGVVATPSFLFGRSNPDGSITGVRWVVGSVPARVVEDLVESLLRHEAK